MPTRNRWRVGDYLVIDDIDGRARYASEVRESYDGLLIDARKRWEELVPHPQDELRVAPEELPPSLVRAPAPTSATQAIDVDSVLGVLLPKGAAQHLFSNTEQGIESMQVSEGSAGAGASAAAFVVR